MKRYLTTLTLIGVKGFWGWRGAVGLLAIALLGFSALPALAHHASGGKTPTNAWEGFVSGLAHPVIGLDHLAFVIAAGLLGAVFSRGWMVPIAFVLTSLVGTGLHLMSWNLPAPELFVSGSVLVFGALLTMKQQPQRAIVLCLGAIAGLFHGYAYGEAIIGAEMQPLVAYLAGFAVIQLVIAIGAYGVARRWRGHGDATPLNLRFAGFTLSGIGGAFLAGVVLG